MLFTETISFLRKALQNIPQNERRECTLFFHLGIASSVTESDETQLLVLDFKIDLAEGSWNLWDSSMA